MHRFRSGIAMARGRLKRYRQQTQLRRSVRRMGDQIKVIVGAGGTNAAGWLPTEYPVVDLLDGRTLERNFGAERVQAFLAEHVWEHFAPDRAALAAQNCYRLLKPAGYLRIAVPDGLHPDRSYIEYVKPGGVGVGSDDHKVLYTYRTLASLLAAVGFDVHLLEWFDETGVFHFQNWDPKDGLIIRSTRFDERNAVNRTAYTSLIADAYKPEAAQQTSAA